MTFWSKERKFRSSWRGTQVTWVRVNQLKWLESWWNPSLSQRGVWVIWVQVIGVLPKEVINHLPEQIHWSLWYIMAQVIVDYWFQSWSSQNNADQIAVKPLPTTTTGRQPTDQADCQISRGECFELQTMHLSFSTQFTPAANEQAMQTYPRKWHQSRYPSKCAYLMTINFPLNGEI